VSRHATNKAQAPAAADRIWILGLGSFLDVGCWNLEFPIRLLSLQQEEPRRPGWINRRGKTKRSVWCEDIRRD
jgi:hypothetical protein